MEHREATPEASEERKPPAGGTLSDKDFLSELRVRANSVVGVLDLLLLSGLTPKQERYAEMARSSGKELLALLVQATQTGSNGVDGEADHEILDASVLRRTRLVEVFLKHMPDYISNLSSAIEKKDTKQVEQMAHKIKGSCLAFGAPRMTQLCMEIEESGRNCHLETAHKNLEQLEDEFEKVRRLLDEKKHIYCDPLA